MYSIHWLLIVFLVVVASAASTSDVETAWQNFKASYGRQYKDLHEEATRKAIFTKAFEKITAHNKRYDEGLVSYYLGINKFADRTREEMNVRNGYKQGKVRSGSFDIVTFVPSGDVPDTLDWREKGAVTRVKDQGDCGSCWAFSTTGTLEGVNFLRTGVLTAISEQNLIDCSPEDGGCNGGLTETALAYVHDQDGIDSEESYPYEAADGQCRFSVAGNVTSTRGYGIVEIGNEDHLKAAIAQVGPISVAVDVTLDDFGYYEGGIFDNAACSSEVVNHGVVAVGYDSENGLDYWIVKNSWADDWGENGYIRVVRNKNNQCGMATEAIYPLNY